MEFADILAALAFLVNGLPVALMAIGYGFASVPTGLAYIAGAAGMAISGQIVPIAFQAESVVLAGKMGKTRQERLNIVFFTGLVMVVVGAFGALGAIIDFIGNDILFAMMAGVGVILAKAGVDMFKSRPIIAAVSVVSAGVTFFALQGHPNQMVYTVIASVFISSIVHLIMIKTGKADTSKNIAVDMSIEKFIPLKLQVNSNIVRSVLALCTMQIGANIAFSEVTASFAGQSANADAVTIYSGIGDSISAFFGGGPVEAIISGTGFAPNPMTAGIILSILFMVVLFAKVVPKAAKYLTTECIAGFLIIVGAISVFSINAASALEISPAIAGVTMVITATSDPFIGMIAGLLVRYGMMLGG